MSSLPEFDCLKPVSPESGYNFSKRVKRHDDMKQRVPKLEEEFTVFTRTCSERI